MSIPSQPLPIVGASDSTEDPKVRVALDELQQILTANIDASNVSAGLAALLGVSDATTTRRGKAIIPSAETSGSTSYAYLGTADKIPGVTVASGGLLVISYRARWLSSSPGAGRAAIFIGSDQIRVPGFNAPAPGETGTPNGTLHAPLHTFPGGLTCDTAAQFVDYPGDTLPTVIGTYLPGSSPLAFQGGLCIVDPGPGTFDVGVKFKALTGTVTVDQRSLRAWSVAF